MTAALGAVSLPAPLDAHVDHDTLVAFAAFGCHYQLVHLDSALSHA